MYQSRVAISKKCIKKEEERERELLIYLKAVKKPKYISCGSYPHLH